MFWYLFYWPISIKMSLSHWPFQNLIWAAKAEKCDNIALTLWQKQLWHSNCLGCDTNEYFEGGGKREQEKKIITYSSPNSPFSRSNTSTPLSPSFLPSPLPPSPLLSCPAPGHVLFFIGISSQSAVLIVHLCRSEGSRAQYGASNYLCPLWCSRTTERLMDPRWGGGGLLLCRV